METIIRKIDKNQINQDVIEEAGNVLKQGGGKENICSKRTSIR